MIIMLLAIVLIPILYYIMANVYAVASTAKRLYPLEKAKERCAFYGMHAVRFVVRNSKAYCKENGD